MGMPVVTSSTPAYVRTMAAAGQDLHCASEADWVETLTRLIEDQDERERSGRGGREIAESEYSEERLLEVWDGVFQGLEAAKKTAPASTDRL
jgi:glycosyltransferase involved in cell wall biosynthesis